MWRVLLLGGLLSCAKTTKPNATPSTTAADRVSAYLATLKPAVMGHRGTGKTRADHPHPENGLSSLQAAMDAGAHGVEIDVELTEDGRLVVMHDDTMDRTTTITGCVSGLTFDAVREARLVDGRGRPTEEMPPTLEEVLGVVGAPAIVNIELKVFGSDCITEDTGPEKLATAVIAEVRRLNAQERVILSSFDDVAVSTVRKQAPELYVGLLGDSDRVLDAERFLTDALALGVQAIHPAQGMGIEGVADALASGLQVNMWTVNGEPAMRSALDRSVTSILTDEPDVLLQLLAAE